MTEPVTVNQGFKPPGADSADAIVSPSVINFIRSCFRRWWLFLLVAILASACGAWYAKSQKTLYQSRLSFALDEGGSGGELAGAMNIAAQLGLNIASKKSDVFAGDNILVILTSRRIIEKVLLSVDTFNNIPYTLIGYYIEKVKGHGADKTGAKFPIGQARKSFTDLQDSVLYDSYQDFAVRHIEAIKPDRKLNIYEIRITTTDEKFTKIVTDRLVMETNSFYTEIRTKKAMSTLDILQERVETLQGHVYSSIAEIATSQDANLNSAMAAARVPVSKQQVNQQVFSTAYTEMFKMQELARFQYLKDIPLLQIIDPADYPMKRIKQGLWNTAILFSVFSLLISVLVYWLIITFTRVLKLNKTYR